MSKAIKQDLVTLIQKIEQIEAKTDRKREWNKKKYASIVADPEKHKLYLERQKRYARAYRLRKKAQRQAPAAPAAAAAPQPIEQH